MDEDCNDDVLVREMFRAMGCGFRYKDIRAKPTRLGSRNINKKRAIKVEMSSEEVVEDIIANKNTYGGSRGDKTKWRIRNRATKQSSRGRPSTN